MGDKLNPDTCADTSTTTMPEVEHDLPLELTMTNINDFIRESDDRNDDNDPLTISCIENIMNKSEKHANVATLMLVMEH